jgi:hypothetical protein
MIRFFIPFYDEIKSLLIIFLMVSRARVCRVIDLLFRLLTCAFRVPNPSTCTSFDL